MTLPREAASARRSVGDRGRVPATIGGLFASAVFEANTDAGSQMRSGVSFLAGTVRNDFLGGHQIGCPLRLPTGEGT